MAVKTTGVTGARPMVHGAGTPSCRMHGDSLPSRQPFVSRIFFFRELPGLFAQLRRGVEPLESRAEKGGEIFTKTVRQIVALNTALVKKTGARAAMGRACDFVSAADHIRSNRIREAGFGNFWRGAAGQKRVHAICLERPANRVVHRGVNLERRSLEK